MIQNKRLSRKKKIICAVSLSLTAFFLVLSLSLYLAPVRATASNTTTSTNADGSTTTTTTINGARNNENPDANNLNANRNPNVYNDDDYGRSDSNDGSVNNPYTTPFEYSDDYGATGDAPNASNDTTSNGRGFTLSFDGDNGTMTSTIRMFLVLTVISLAPSILVMLTSFTKIIVVLHFIRSALNTQTAPPNQVITGLALFLTLFIMWPTFQDINTNAIQPLDRGELTLEEALPKAEEPLREFMYGQTQTKDVDLFCEIANVTYDDYDDVPFIILVPAFILSELREAFIIGFLVYIPFIVIDMVVSSILMSMGMMMLPPSMISMPFKILLFILADGWNLIIGSLVKTFY